MADLRFPRSEKLKSRKDLTELFEGGRSYTFYPVKVLYKFSVPAIEPTCQAAFTVSKRNFKRSVDRNRIKRLMREAYRLNKELFYQKLKTSGGSCRLTFIFLDRKLPEFSQIQDKIILILQRLIDDYEENTKRDHGTPDKSVSEGD